MFQLWTGCQRRGQSLQSDAFGLTAGPDSVSLPTPQELRSYSRCQLCPRACGVDRLAGERGLCGETATPRLGAITAHAGEEPPISSLRGSGTFFFSGCGVRCFFCQNGQIAFEGLGRVYTWQSLYAAALRLVAQGVHNLNFVTPAPHWPTVAWLSRVLREAGCTLPRIANCSGHHEVRNVMAFAQDIDIFLPDFKYAFPELAAECMGDHRYPELALAAIETMITARGFLMPFDETGRVPAQCGVMVRHLVLPGELENSLRTLRLLRARFGRHLPLAVMSQFTPQPACQARGRFARRVTGAEYSAVVIEAERLGFESLLIQAPTPDEHFVPDFKKAQPFDRFPVGLHSVAQEEPGPAP